CVRDAYGSGTDFW
nr:immunoglobulin heavy chain junction region [Macaca mulatta]